VLEPNLNLALQLMMQGFGAILEASKGWATLLTGLLQELGPVNVRDISRQLNQTKDSLPDELFTG
jgi:hypothetical protein